MNVGIGLTLSLCLTLRHSQITFIRRIREIRYGKRKLRRGSDIIIERCIFDELPMIAEFIEVKA